MPGNNPQQTQGNSLASVTARQREESQSQKDRHQEEARTILQVINHQDSRFISQTRGDRALWTVCYELAQKDQLTPLLASKLLSFGQGRSRHRSMIYRRSI